MKHIERRRKAIGELERKLLHRGSPRRDMLLVVLVTGASAFWICYLLLELGVVAMWVRYPMAVLASYPVFVAMLRVWLTDAGSLDRSRESHLDLNPDIPFDIGGDPACDPVVGGEGFGGSGGHFSIDLDDALVILIPILLALSVLIYGLYVAPVILAELLLDGALMAGLYHQFKGVPRQHWMRTCIRKTFWMFLVTAVLLSFAGLATQANFPHATSIGVLWDTVMR